MNDPIHIISLGAGVQSSTMALMAAAGEITPMPKCAIFADTQAEPKSVYVWLDWLEKQLPFPVHRVSKGSLAKVCTTPYWSEKNKKLTTSGIPAFLKRAIDGQLAMMPRQCTRDFKVDPVTKAVNKERRAHATAPAVLWIGISIDEVYRAKEHRNAPRIINRHPLMELRMHREDCKAWMARHSFTEPPRSACTFCPYHNNAEWRRIRDKEPEAFASAVQFEKDLQTAHLNGTLNGTPFLHRSMKPLSEVDFSTEEDRGQLNMFNNECEGMCGV